MNRSEMISRLSGTAPTGYSPVDRQTAGDIIREMRIKHAECASDYDKIVDCIDASQSLYTLCFTLWKFCRDNMIYKVEDGENQLVSCPYTILTGRSVDCKNYALFIAGLLDALKRKGHSLTWCFRYASYQLMDPTPGHVFVVVNKDTSNVWVDPVVSPFNFHLPYIWHKDKKPVKAAAVGRIAVIGGNQSAENQLLGQLSEYQQGLIQAVTLSKTTNTVNTITAAVITGITSALVPGLAVALKVLSLAQAPLNNAFGVGSVAARVYSDITSLNVISLFNDVFNGRTYNSDQYWGAAFYYYYVQGQNITNQDQVSDTMVAPALKWFIDRTGVFISGRQHIMGLIAGASTYMNYSKVDPDTTTNPAQVQAAVKVAQSYWKISGTPNENYASFDPAFKGSWANTVGVFDTGLTAIAAQYAETAETYAAQTGDQYATNENAGLPATAPAILSAFWDGSIFGVPKKYILIALAAFITIDLID